MRTTEGLYECHVTMAYPDEPLWHAFNALAAEHQWHTSWIDGDPMLGEKRYFYFTTLAGSEGAAYRRMDDLIANLPARPLRRKIEHVVVDVRE